MASAPERRLGIPRPPGAARRTSQRGSSRSSQRFAPANKKLPSPLAPFSAWADGGVRVPRPRPGQLDVPERQRTHAGRSELRTHGSGPGGAGEGGKRPRQRRDVISTARWRGSGKRDGGVYAGCLAERYQSMSRISINAPELHHPAILGQHVYRHLEGWLARAGQGVQIIVADNALPPAAAADGVVRFSRQADKPPVRVDRRRDRLTPHPFG